MANDSETTKAAGPSELMAWQALSNASERLEDESELITPMSNAKEHCVLVVDDEPTVRKCLDLCLTREEFECQTAADGEEALSILEQSHFDVVITDLRMPNMHGHALARKLLEKPDRPVIVVLTAVDDPRMAKDLILRGVDDVMFKPVKFESFAAKVKALLRRSERDLLKQESE